MSYPLFGRKKESRPPLKELYKQIHELGTSLQFAGFGILCKDMIEFLAARGYGGEAIETFRTAFNKAIESDRYYWEAFYPEALANLGALEGYPSGMAEAASNQKFKLPAELCDKNLVNEWTRLLGWTLFREYSQAIKDYIEEALATDIPDEEQKERQEVIELAEKLLGTAVTEDFYWYPLVLYLALLLYKTDFHTLQNISELETLNA